jgi:hypothetical protein
VGAGQDFATKLALGANSAKHTKLTDTSLCLCAFVARAQKKFKKIKN